MSFLNSLFASTPTNQYSASQDQGLNQQNYGGMVNNANAAQSSTNMNQNALLQQQLAQSRGGGPNLAQTQLQNALQQTQAQGASALASTQGINQQGAARSIMNNQATQAMGMAGQSASLRQQLQLAAQQQAAGLTGQMQQGNIAQLQNATTGNQNQNALNYQNYANTQNINASVASQNATIQEQQQQAAANFVGGLLNGAGAAGASFIPQPGAPTSSPPATTNSNSTSPASNGGTNYQQGDGSEQGNAVGGMVPGAPDESDMTDTVPAILRPGEVVLPPSVAKDPAVTASFMKALRANSTPATAKNVPSVSAAPTPKGYGQLIASHRALQQRIGEIERKLGAGTRRV